MRFCRCREDRDSAHDVHVTRFDWLLDGKWDTRKRGGVVDGICAFQDLHELVGRAYIEFVIRCLPIDAVFVAPARIIVDNMYLCAVLYEQIDNM